MELMFALLIIFGGIGYIIYKGLFPQGVKQEYINSKHRKYMKDTGAVFKGSFTDYAIDLASENEIWDYFKGSPEMWLRLEAYREKFPEYCQAADKWLDPYSWKDVGDHRVADYNKYRNYLCSLLIQTFGMVRYFDALNIKDGTPWAIYLRQHVFPPVLDIGVADWKKQRREAMDEWRREKLSWRNNYPRARIVGLDPMGYPNEIAYRKATDKEWYDNKDSAEIMYKKIESGEWVEKDSEETLARKAWIERYPRGRLFYSGVAPYYERVYEWLLSTFEGYNSPYWGENEANYRCHVDGDWLFRIDKIPEDVIDEYFKRLATGEWTIVEIDVEDDEYNDFKPRRSFWMDRYPKAALMFREQQRKHLNKISFDNHIFVSYKSEEEYRKKMDHYWETMPEFKELHEYYDQKISSGEWKEFPLDEHTVLSPAT